MLMASVDGEPPVLVTLTPASVAAASTGRRRHRQLDR